MMSLTSFSFICFFLASLLIYYLVPHRFQWIALLLFSGAFFLLSSTPYTIVYLLASMLSAFLCTRAIVRCKQKEQEKKAKAALVLGIVFNLAMLAGLKYTNFLLGNINALFGTELASVSWAAPMGISFYTLQVLGYLLDSYWGIAEPETNFFKTALFVGYYPQLTSGPISRWGDMRPQLFAGHAFQWKNLIFGWERMLWGLFKKLVIAAPLGTVVDTIYADPAAYPGLYIWLAAALFIFQLYADFSGCMDIILGASECYGIVLPENFRSPLFSRSVQEYWQRWHITLGAWLRDYILYPVLRSDAWRALGKRLRGRVSKRAARLIPAQLGALIVWLLIGLWHGGGWKYVLGQGLWFWFWILLGQVLEPTSKKINAALHIRTDSLGWHLWQSVRSFALVAFGDMFFRLASIPDTLHTMAAGFSCFNPWIFFDGSLYALGVTRQELTVAFLGLGLQLLVSVLQEKSPVRERLARQDAAFQILVMLSLLMAVLIFGQYGPGYNAASFIYANF